MPDTEYTILDIETTGLSAYSHKITEIAAMKVKMGQVMDEFHSLINPGVHIPSFITRLTGIDDEMVKDAPPIHDVIPTFVDFLGGSVIVAHNATFDYKFLHYNSEVHIGKGFGNDRLCTRKLAYRLLPDLTSRRLGCVCEHLGIVNEQAHRAMGDVKATTQVFSTFLDQLNKIGIAKREDIMQFESWPASKCWRLMRESDVEGRS